MTTSLLNAFAGLALMYVLFSTVTIALVGCAARLRMFRAAEFRVALWKWGLFAPCLLVVGAALFPSPHWLPRWQLGSAASNATSEPQVTQATSVDARGEVLSATENSSFDSEPRRFGTSESPGDQGSEVTGSSNDVPSQVGFWLAASALAAWFAVALVGLWNLLRQGLLVARLVRRSRAVTGGEAFDILNQLRQRAKIDRDVELLVSSEIESPLTGGIFRSFIIVPARFWQRLGAEQRTAILAHELAHVARRDVKANVLTALVCRVGWFQPLNAIAQRQVRIETELVADRWAADLLRDGLQLARCLTELGGWLTDRSHVESSALAVGMAPRSALGRRVEALLNSPPDASGTRVVRHRQLWLTLMLAFALLWCSVPRASAHFYTPIQISDMRNPRMKSTFYTFSLLAALGFGPAIEATAEEEVVATAKEGPAEPIAVPKELEGFSGMLIGRLASRDIERGEFHVTVDYVARVWPNNKARQPRAAVGKTFVIDGVTGKWLDTLLLVRPGETVEFEAQHRGGETLTFPGEWLKKASPFDPSEHPVPPEAFRGFSGIVVGKVKAKHEDSHELTVEVADVERSFDRSRASDAESVVGKSIVVAGFWGNMNKPYEPLKVGDQIRVGLVHRVSQSDHFSVAEVIEKVESTTDRPQEKTASTPDSAEKDGAFPKGMRGFRGILRGTLVSRDVEKGELTFKAERATRVWKQNKASDVESCEGHVFEVEGISGKWLDVLLTLKPGDRIEVEAFHNRGEHLDFVGEWLKKAE